MRLSENQEIVECLIQILEDYDFLKYDKKRPISDNNFEGLHIKLKKSADRSVQTIQEIRDKLEKVTDRKYFYIYGGSSSGGDNFSKVWTFFTLRESEIPLVPELNILKDQICSEIERLSQERNIDIKTDFEITVSDHLKIKFFNYLCRTSFLLSIVTETISNLKLEEKFSTVYYEENNKNNSFELLLSSSEEMSST